MSLLNIVKEPDPILRKKSTNIDIVDKSVQKLMNDMLETMYHAPGIGLAACQIGILKKIIVIDLAKEEQPKNPIFIVNPKIVWKSDNLVVREEGCLSIPGYFAEISRPNECTLEYQDFHGKAKKLEAKDLLATCIQHEVDHCNGILFIDYLSKLKKDMIVKKLNKIQKDTDQDIF